MRKIAVLFALVPLLGTAYAQSIALSSELSPSTLFPGGEGYLTITVKNNGKDDLSDVYVKIESIGTPLSAEAKDLSPRYIGGIKSNGSTPAIYKLGVSKDAAAGQYPVQFGVYRYSAGSTERVLLQYFLIPVDAPSMLLVKSITPTSFRPGEMTTMGINLQNTGSSRLTNLQLSWQASNDTMLPFGSDGTVVVQELAPKGELRVETPVVVSVKASPGIYYLTIKATYYDAVGNQRSTNASVGITIGGGTDFAAIAQMSGSTLSITVANAGVNPATAVSIRLKRELGYVESFLGNLNPGDSSVANFPVSRANGTEASQARRETARLEIIYTDTLGERKSIEKEVPISVSGQGGAFQGMQAQQGQRSYTNALLGAAGIIAVVLLFKFAKRKPE